MSTLSNILDQVLAKALPAAALYADLNSDKRDSQVWSKLEDTIGGVYHSYLRSLLSDPHVERRADDLPYAVAPACPPPFGANVTLGAINQRGLFRQNGRATLLEPCGAFSPRTTEAGRHDALHHVYMHLVLVQKAESINQLFLGTTNLPSLAVILGEEGDPCIEISHDGLHGTVHVSTTLADLLAKHDLRHRWKEAIQRILTDLKAGEILDSVRRKGRLPPELSLLVEPQYRPDQLDPLDVIRRWPKLFSQWLSIYPKEKLPNIEKAGILFGSWLWSIAWLMFYCQEEVAGRFFYTVRLPPIIEKPERVLPETFAIHCLEGAAHYASAG